MSNSEIRFGVIGLGAIGRDHCEQIAAQKDAVLAAVADISEQSGQSFSDNYDVPWYRGYHELLSRDDVDVVVISTPSGLHGEITVAAARAGKHVLVEKPMEISLAKADEMIEECARNRVKLAVHYPLRFSQDILKAKKAIEMGLLGKLVLGEAIYKKYRSQEYYDRGGWRGTWQLDGGGVIMNQTIHPIDILQWFMGDVESVSALTRTTTHKIEAEDLAVAVLGFRSGALGSIIGTSAVCSTREGIRALVHGQKGTIVTANDRLERREFEDSTEWPELEVIPKNPCGDMIDSIENDRKPFVDGIEGRKSLEIVLALYESARTGETVKLPVPARQPTALTGI